MFGFGSSAHIAMQVARHRGCEVYVVTRGAKHRKHALALGAVWAGERAEELPVRLDGAILFAPVGELVPPAMRALRSGATLAIAGIHLTAIPSMSYGEHIFHEKRLTSVEANTRRDGEELLREAAAIPIRPAVLPFPLEEANDALLSLNQDRVAGTAVLIP